MRGGDAERTGASSGVPGSAGGRYLRYDEEVRRAHGMSHHLQNLA